MTVHQRETRTKPRGPRPELPYFVAQQYAQLGFNTFPVRHQSKVSAVKWKAHAYNPVDFTRNYAFQGKDPDTGKGVTVRKVSLDKKVNLGLRTGFEYGLAVIEFYTPKTFIRALRANPRLLNYPLVKTPWGIQLYYSPEAEERSRKFEGGEIAGENRKIIAPPSILPSSEQYKLLRGNLSRRAAAL